MMKVKARPGDFVVEEQLSMPPLSDSAGAHAIYRLGKSGLTTLECCQLLSRRFRIPDNAIHYAGMKDKYATTTQYLSIAGGRLTTVEERNFKLTRLGFADRPIGPDLLTGNAFTITLRDIETGKMDALAAALSLVAESGVPNYFDEQRFGSARHGEGWIARDLLQRKFESALRLAIATPSREDRPRIKAAKKMINARWGDWAGLAKSVPNRPERDVLAHLVSHPADFSGAVNALGHRLLSIYFAAYQSFLWNETAAAYLRLKLPLSRLLEWPYQQGKFVFYKPPSDRPDLSDSSDLSDIRTVSVPLLGHNTELSDPAMRAVVEPILQREKIALADFRLPEIKSAFFKSAERALILCPENLTSDPPQPDEAYPGRLCVTLRFSLHSGSYATIVIKRLQAALGG